MSVQQFAYCGEGFSSTPSQQRGNILVSGLKPTADGGTNKDGSSYQVYDWIGAEKLGFSPTVTFATKVTDTSTMLTVKITLPCASYESQAAADDGGKIEHVVPWTCTLTVRGGASNLTATSVSNLKSLIDSLSGMLLLDPSDGSFDAQSPVLNSLLRGNALVR